MAADLAPEAIRELTAEILTECKTEAKYILNTYSFKGNTFKEKYTLDIRQSEEGVLNYHITEQGLTFISDQEFPRNKDYRQPAPLSKQMEKGAFTFYETVRRLNRRCRRRRIKKILCWSRYVWTF